MEEPLLSLHEVRRILGVDIMQVIELVHRDELHAGTRGGKVLVPERALREYQQRQTQASR